VPRGNAPDQMPVVLVETIKGFDASQHDSLRDELLDLAARNPLTRRITEVIIRDVPLPTDIRHNSKIFREQLTAEVNA